MAAAGGGLLAMRASAAGDARKRRDKSGDPDRGLKLRVASYSTRKFSLDETIDMLQALNVRHVTLKSMHLPYENSREERQAAAKKIKDAGIALMGGGVIYLKNDEKQILDAFEYCRDAGMTVMVAAPDLDALPTVENMVKEFDIRVAIHNHGPGDQKYPSPLDAYRIANDYDSRIGVCIDIGHSVRIGEDEIEVIYAVKDRLYDFHIKDVTERTARGANIEVGRGVIDIPGVLKALLDLNFTGHVALEYEKDENNPLPGMKESFGYIRGVLAAL
jgi:sugar phosphate isomerase/epimerase